MVSPMKHEHLKMYALPKDRTFHPAMLVYQRELAALLPRKKKYAPYMEVIWVQSYNYIYIYTPILVP